MRDQPPGIEFAASLGCRSSSAQANIEVVEICAPAWLQPYEESSMAQIDLAIPHGQSQEAASAKLQEAIPVMRTRLGAWIRRIEWDDDKQCAFVSGPGFEIRMWVDERDLHGHGKVPMTWKIFEGIAKRYARRAIELGVANALPQ
jgi:hypothetical protein